MRNKKLRSALPRCLLSALLMGGIATTATVRAVDGIGVNDLALFELEGNFVDNPAGGPTDWDVLHSGTMPANLITFTGVLQDPAPKTIFWKGGSKDVNDVSEWWFKEGSVSDKSNITNAYAAAYTAPADVCVNNLTDNLVVACTAQTPRLHKQGDLIVYFGMDRFANSGDTFGGFWFFQDPAVGLGAGSSGQFTGNHIAATTDDPGDVLVLVEYPQASGAKPEIKVYEWDPNQVRGANVAPNLHLVYSASQAECDNTGNIGKLACAKVNLQTLPNPPWDYTPKGGNDSSDMPTQTFFEGGINLTGILGSTPCISSYLAETRSSRSETASLEDFAFGGFEACGANITKSCEADINEVGDEVTVTFWGEVNNTGLPLDVELQDSVPGLDVEVKFTKVCVDGSDNTTPDGRCAGEANIAGFTPDVAIAEFSLGGGQTVVYEGEYRLGAGEFDETTSFLDTVTLRFYDPGTGVLIGTKNATAKEACPPNGEPGLLVTKSCSAQLSEDAETIDRTIEGTVKNTGNVKLSNLSLIDDPLDTSTFTIVVDKNFDGKVDAGDGAFSLGGDLQPGVQLAYEHKFSDPGLTHEDQIYATGVNVFDGETVTSETASVNGCEPELVQGLAITKECAPEDNGVQLKLVNGVLVVEVSNVIRVENVGQGGVGEPLTVIVSDDEVQQLVQTANQSPAFVCTEGDSCTGTLKYGEFVTFEQTYHPDLDLAEGDVFKLSDSDLVFSNTATATGSGVFSEQAVVPDPTATADCPLCPVPDSN